MFLNELNALVQLLSNIFCVPVGVVKWKFIDFVTAHLLLIAILFRLGWHILSGLL